MGSSRLSAVLPALLLTSSLVNAQTGSSSMGQLFTSPQERAYLDYLREDFLERTASQGFDIQTEEIPEIETEEPEQNVQFRLDAVITNGDGSHTIWLNGSPIRERDLPADVRLVTRSNQNVLRISTSSATYLLKPGQTINLSTGRLSESFESLPGTGSGSATEAVTANPPEPASTSAGARPRPQSQAQGVVAIQDLIDALQMMQSGNNEASETTQ